MRRTEYFCLEWSNITKLFVVNILIKSERSFFEFLSIRDKFKNISESHAFNEFAMEFMSSSVFEVVIWGNEPKFSRHYISFSIISLISFNTFGVFKFLKYIFDSFSKPFLNWLVIIGLKPIIIGIFKYSSEHKWPSYPLNTICCVVNLSSGDLGIDMMFNLLM